MTFRNFKWQIQDPSSLASNRVTLRQGFDGTEPKELLQMLEGLGGVADAGWRRFTVAMNTYYPELFGGYYENGFILLLVQRAVAESGLCLAKEDIADESHIIPDELAGVIERREPHLVLERRETVGRCVLWSIDVAGCSSFYRDNMMLTFAIPEATGLRVFRHVENCCRSARVPCEQLPIP